MDSMIVVRLLCYHGKRTAPHKNKERLNVSKDIS
jgi:hypothetical protein